jgi:hypothetical protein
MTTTLVPVSRGDTFVYTFTLGGGYTGATFTGGVKWTLRATVPGVGSVADDPDDSEVVAQASVAGGEITFDGAVGTINIPASATTTWPVKRLYWDLQGVVSGSPDEVYTIDSGSIVVKADITRSA